MKRQSRRRQEKREIIHSPIDAWWLSVLAGSSAGSHPVMNEIKARMDGDTVVLSGTVAAERDRDDVEREVRGLQSPLITGVRNEIEVKPTNTEQPGLTTQVVMAFYATAEQAEFAREYLETLDRRTMIDLELAADPSDPSWRALVPPDFHEDVEQALLGERVALIAKADETDAFKLREIIDEETRSLATLVAPPQAVETRRRPAPA
jgi:hypothetical protein